MSSIDTEGALYLKWFSDSSIKLISFVTSKFKIVDADFIASTGEIDGVIALILFSIKAWNLLAKFTTLLFFIVTVEIALKISIPWILCWI